VDLTICDLDALGEFAKVIAAVTAAGDPYAFVGGRGEFPHHGWRGGLLLGAFEGAGHSLRIGLRLIAARFQAGYSPFQRRVVPDRPRRSRWRRRAA
jgi:hypothetical protein